MANELDGSNRNKEMERVLLDVIQILHDGQKGFADIGERLKDEHLKRYFLAESLKRANFRAELENELHRAGMADVKESGTLSGTLRRSWGDLKAAFGGDEHTLLATRRGAPAAGSPVADRAAVAHPQFPRLRAEPSRCAGGQITNPPSPGWMQRTAEVSAVRLPFQLESCYAIGPSPYGRAVCCGRFGTLRGESLV